MDGRGACARAPAGRRLCRHPRGHVRGRCRPTVLLAVRHGHTPVRPVWMHACIRCPHALEAWPRPRGRGGESGQRGRPDEALSGALRGGRGKGLWSRVAARPDPPRWTDRGSGWEELEAPTTSPVGDVGSQAGGTQAVVACRYPARRRPPRSPATRRHSPEGGSVWPMEGSRQAGDRGSNTSTERQRSAPRLSQMQPLRVSEAWPLFLRRRRVQVARGGSGGRTGGRHVASRPLHVWLAL